MIVYEDEEIEVWDAHAHVGARKKLARHKIPAIMEFSPEEMLTRMDAAGIDGATPFAIGAGERSDYADLNALIAKAAKDNPSRMVGFMRLSPTFGVEHNLSLIDQAVADGLRGIKIHPLIENCPADDHELVYPLMERAEADGLVVIYHCGNGEWASPDRIAHVAKDFPGLKVIAGHSGLVEGIRRVTEHAQRIPNLYMDSSCVGWIPYFCESIAWAGPDRVLFGSDTPFNPFEMELDKIVRYANAHLKLPVEHLRMILGGNLKRLLDIE